MISRLQGKVIYRGHDFVIIDVSGVGYKVSFPESAALSLSDEASLFCHTVVREDTIELFGFISIEQLELFWKLISISGVGPKIAQKLVLSKATEEIRKRIMSGDLAFLTSIPGIGAKIGQKIILELKGTLADESPAGLDREAVEALVGLGYSRRQAEAALSEIADTAKNTDERIRLALKSLGR